MTSAALQSPDERWPALPYAEWKDTYGTLHLWTQIVGKVRLARTPWLNHSWHVALQVTPKGLRTGPIPHDALTFELEFDLIDQQLRLRTEMATDALELRAMPVAAFCAAVMGKLDALGVPVKIHGAPNELLEPTPFADDHAPRAYDPDQARRFSSVLSQADRVLKTFRTGFLGKASPVHFFWGSFDLAVSRFSGRRAPLHPGGFPHMPEAVVREAYSHEVSSAGFWPGGPGMEQAVFYSYAYPEPPGYRQSQVQPPAAQYDGALGEFLLPYDAVRTAADPDRALMGFLDSTYSAAADCGGWDRAALECAIGAPGRPRPV